MRSTPNPSISLGPPTRFETASLSASSHTGSSRFHASGVSINPRTLREGSVDRPERDRVYVNSAIRLHYRLAQFLLASRAMTQIAAAAVPMSREKYCVLGHVDAEASASGGKRVERRSGTLRMVSWDDRDYVYLATSVCWGS